MHHEKSVDVPYLPLETHPLTIETPEAVPPPTPDVLDVLPNELPAPVDSPEDEKTGEAYRRELLARALGTERTAEKDAALAELLHLYKPLLRYKLGFWGKSATDIEDIVQETFVRTWRHFSNFSGTTAHLGRYLVVTATNYTISQHRWAAVRPTEVPLDVSFMESPGGELATRVRHEFVRDIGNQDVIDGILALLDGVSPDKAELARLLLQDHSLPECATILDVPLGTVKSRAFYLERIVRKAFAEPEDVTSPRLPEADAEVRSKSDPYWATRKELARLILVAAEQGKENRPALQDLVQNIALKVQSSLNDELVAFNIDAFEKDLFASLTGAEQTDPDDHRFEAFVKEVTKEASPHAAGSGSRDRTLGDAMLSGKVRQNISKAQQLMSAYEAFLWRIRAETIFGFIRATSKDRSNIHGPKMEQLLRAHYMEGLNADECGEKFGIRPSVAAYRVSTCLPMLRSIFRKDSIL